MIARRSLFAAIAVFCAFGVSQAADQQTYKPQAFAAAQADGKPILVHIYAPWCPTCRAQEPILGKLEQDAKFANLVVFRVDFDGQKDAVRAFKANQQSTLIVFKGAVETGRSVGDTGPASIAALLDKAL
jgi:thioredoxin 1